jgi:hypothetical protein
VRISDDAPTPIGLKRCRIDEFITREKAVYLVGTGGRGRVGGGPGQGGRLAVDIMNAVVDCN